MTWSKKGRLPRSQTFKAHTYNGGIISGKTFQEISKTWTFFHQSLIWKLLARVFRAFECPYTASVQFSSVAQSCLTLCDPMNRSMPGLPAHHQLLEFTQTHIHWVGDAIQPSHPPSPLLLPPSIFPSIKVFTNESVLRISWRKYWSFSFNISPSNEYSGLICSRMDWLDLLAVQGTLKSLHQHHSSKASIFRCSAFFLYSPTLVFNHDYWKNNSLD